MYVPLHVHSCYSFLSSPSSVEELVDAAHREGMPCLALTDYDGLYGAVPFYKAARARGIKPILGTELSLSDGSRITLLAKDLVGYRSLCRLITRLIDRTQGIDREDLDRHRAGLVCLSGSRRGAVARRLLAHQYQDARHLAASFREIFGEDYFLEMQWGPGDRDRWLLAEITRLGLEMRIPCVATPNAHYVSPDDEILYRVLASIRTRTALAFNHPEKETRLPLHLPRPREMARRFCGYPESLRNTAVVAERCELRFSLGRAIFPRFPLPEGETASSYLRKLSFEGARRRYGTLSEEITRRLEYELDVIERVGYSEYFLISWDICREAARRGIWIVARGSAADSLVCYVLGISHVCPLKYDLYFERFLNPERMVHSGLADIDLDVPWDRRDELVEYVYHRYGFEHCATISSMVCMNIRAAVGEVGKVVGLAPQEIHRFTKCLPHSSTGDLDETIRALAECRNLPVDREPFRTILAIAKRLVGIPRHLGMHPCGLVVSRDPLTDLVPLQRTAKGPLVTQFDMDPIEELGLVKIDLLGQAGLTVIKEAVDTIERLYGVRIDPYSLPPDDEATWDLIARGEARGCFQIESPAMCNLLKMLNCRDMECLIAALSIIRPGAANLGKMHQFARRYQGLEPVGYPHESLRPVLERTYGIMVYEEHVLMVVSRFAGMNLGRADLLRRALVKWDSRYTVDQFEQEFREGARRNGYTEEEIDRVWRFITEFSGYAFNKAHSSSYAILAYQAAYLKAHYPAALLAAVLSSGRGFYSRFVYTLEARRLGIDIRGPDLNASQAERYTVETGAVRVPLAQVKQVSVTLARRIVEDRCRNGRFKSLEDLLRRVPMDPAIVGALIRCGACDGWGQTRPALLWCLETLRDGTFQAARPAPRYPRRSTAGSRRRSASPVTCFTFPMRAETQLTLFDTSDETERTAVVPQGIRDYSCRRKMEIEMDLLGFTVSGHPLDYYDGVIDWSRYVPAADLPACLGRKVVLCGLMVESRRTVTLKGEYMKFISVADRSGIVETVLFPPVYRRYGHLTAERGVLEFHGTVEPFENKNGFVLNVSRVAPLAN